eukprot:31-Prymnesium_polylepis.1
MQVPATCTCVLQRGDSRACREPGGQAGGGVRLEPLDRSRVEAAVLHTQGVTESRGLAAADLRKSKSEPRPCISEHSGARQRAHIAHTCTTEDGAWSRPPGQPGPTTGISTKARFHRHSWATPPLVSCVGRGAVRRRLCVCTV